MVQKELSRRGSELMVIMIWGMSDVIDEECNHYPRQ